MRVPVEYSEPLATWIFLGKVRTGHMRWMHMCSYALCLFIKNKSWPLEKAKSRQQKNNEHLPPRDRGNLISIKIFRSGLKCFDSFCFASPMPAAQLLHRKIHRVCVVLNWLRGSSCCYCRCFWVQYEIFFVVLLDICIERMCVITVVKE